LGAIDVLDQVKDACMQSGFLDDAIDCDISPVSKDRITHTIRAVMVSRGAVYSARESKDDAKDALRRLHSPVVPKMQSTVFGDSFGGLQKCHVNSTLQV